jgi:hypothetical protein
MQSFEQRGGYNPSNPNTRARRRVPRPKLRSLDRGFETIYVPVAPQLASGILIRSTSETDPLPFVAISSTTFADRFRAWRTRVTTESGQHQQRPFMQSPELASPRRLAPYGPESVASSRSRPRRGSCTTSRSHLQRALFTCPAAWRNSAHPPSAAAEKVEPVLEPVVTSRDRGRGTKDHHRRRAKQELHYG